MGLDYKITLKSYFIFINQAFIGFQTSDLQKEVVSHKKKTEDFPRDLVKDFVFMVAPMCNFILTDLKNI